MCIVICKFLYIHANICMLICTCTKCKDERNGASCRMAYGLCVNVILHNIWPTPVLYLPCRYVLSPLFLKLWLLWIMVYSLLSQDWKPCYLLKTVFSSHSSHQEENILTYFTNFELMLYLPVLILKIFQTSYVEFLETFQLMQMIFQGHCFKFVKYVV